MTTPQQLYDELIARRAAQTSLAPYANYMLGVTPADHHALICQNIDDLLADDYDELIILAPPGSAKSTYTSVALPSFYVGHQELKSQPSNILTASYSTELAEKWGRRVRNTLQDPRFHNIFPNTSLAKDAAAISKWATQAGSEFYAAGVGSGILGFRADLGLIDDPISGFEEAQSTTQLIKVHNWYESDFLTRFKPNGKLILICQRLAALDLAGYLIERNKKQRTRRQKVLKLPMIAVDEDTDPLRRLKGQRLWPDYFTEAQVIDARRDEFKWLTLYQQEPPSESGTWVDAECIQWADEIPDALAPTYMTSDLALSVNTGDHSVHMVWRVGPKKELFLIDFWRGRKSAEEVAQAHVELLRQYAPDESLIDDDNAAKVYAHLLYYMARQGRVSVPWKALPIRGQDKETRAAAIRGYFRCHKVWFYSKLKPRLTWFLEEIRAFPNAIGDGIDDGIDNASLMGRRLAFLAQQAPPDIPPPPPRTLNDMTLNELWAAREGQGIRFKRA